MNFMLQTEEFLILSGVTLFIVHPSCNKTVETLEHTVNLKLISEMAKLVQ